MRSQSKARRWVAGLLAALVLAFGVMLVSAPAASAGSNGQQIEGHSLLYMSMVVCGANQTSPTSSCHWVGRDWWAHPPLPGVFHMDGYWWKGFVEVGFCGAWIGSSDCYWRSVIVPTQWNGDWIDVYSPH